VVQHIAPTKGVVQGSCMGSCRGRVVQHIAPTKGVVQGSCMGSCRGRVVQHIAPQHNSRSVRNDDGCAHAMEEGKGRKVDNLARGLGEVKGSVAYYLS
jgi:hypothetical protein